MDILTRYRRERAAKTIKQYVEKYDIRYTLDSYTTDQIEACLPSILCATMKWDCPLEDTWSFFLAMVDLLELSESTD